jgi:hypothetical protein|tara:strand:- start:3095 stop:3967 length:873 start_codon:yes stop_codon:yes gene_type:complete
MSKKLIHNTPQRIFTFGCSFTGYQWGTWANILGVEFPEAEFRNFGRSGAGNQYIHNMIMQADNVYNFTHEDLVIVQWTNVCREDRYLPEKDGWLVPGNIFSQGDYNQNFIENYFSEFGSYVRDFALIKSAHQLLKHRCNHHMIKMLDFEYSNQWELKPNPDLNLQTLTHMYEESIGQILPSFYATLWNNNLEAKLAKDKKIVHKLFHDGHPTPLEHYDYLKTVFKHDWSDKTDKVVGATQKKWVKLMTSACLGQPGQGFSLYEMKQRWLDMLKYETIMRPNTQINPLIRQ